MEYNSKYDRLLQLNERQLALAAVMAESDAHASKCMKLGLNFAETYPDEYTAYITAREEYNANEVEIERIKNEVESEVINDLVD